MKGLVVHVLVLSAARIQPVGSMVEIGHREVWAEFTTNLGSHMLFTDLFYHQKKTCEPKTGMYLRQEWRFVVNG